MVLKSSQRRQPFLPLKESIEFFTLRSSLFPSKGVSLFLPFYLFTFLPLFKVCRVLTPLVQQLNVALGDVAGSESLLYDVLIVG